MNQDEEVDVDEVDQGREANPINREGRDRDGIPRNFNIGPLNGAISVVTLPSLPAPELRDCDIICANDEMPMEATDHRPGNMRLNDIIKEFVQEWSETGQDPIMGDTTVENIKRRIEEQDEAPIFLLWDVEYTCWRVALDDEIAREIRAGISRRLEQAGVIREYDDSPSSDIVSELTQPSPHLRNNDIMCSDGIAIGDDDPDRHPGNKKMKDIIQEFLLERNDIRLDQPNQIVEDRVATVIRTKIEELDGHPRFLVRFNTGWRPAGPDEIKREISGEVRRQWTIRREIQVGLERQNKARRQRHMIVAAVMIVMIIVAFTVRSRREIQYVLAILFLLILAGYIVLCT